jgi:pyruvate/2-oxoglutarate dehydrogenase complex dihydrolipoamide acyltransferase (E2) component
MQVSVELPSMGDDADGEAIVSYWLVEDGDMVPEGADLVELTTDKASFSVPCPRRGRLIEKTVEEGDSVCVGDVLCVLET